MSRFEPDVEPSMEEILASIRKIIAEDTSGSRAAPPIRPASSSPSPSPSLLMPRAPTNPQPAAAPQRGFMSRETFLRSSTPAAEETAKQRPYFPSVSPQEPQFGVKADAKAETSQPSSREGEKVDAKLATPTPAVEPVKPTYHTSEKPVRADHDVIEAKVTDDAERRLWPSPTPAETKAETAAQVVDVPLVDLLSEDLKPLHHASEGDLAKPEIESEAEAVGAESAEPSEDLAQEKASEPDAEFAQTSTAAAESLPSVGDEPVKNADTKDTSDPFAFDLGPSPFQSRATTELPAERHISIDPNSTASRDGGSAYGERDSHKVNGSPAASDFDHPAAPAAKSDEPRAPASDPSQGPARPAFAVPSVSATLGPHRRLEPLADAFKPAPADHRNKPEVAPVNPFPRRDFGLSSEKPSPSEPRPDRLDAMLKPSLPLPSVLPTLSGTADNVAGNGDRAMEDAVADLLRPLLKTWLAENMPRIVERALQREMTESLLSGDKNSRD